MNNIEMNIAIGRLPEPIRAEAIAEIKYLQANGVTTAEAIRIVYERFVK